METKHTKAAIYKPVKYDPLLPTKIIFPAFDNEQEATKYAQLVVESINVTNECYLTPRQLLEQRNELLQSLQFIAAEGLKALHSGDNAKHQFVELAIKNTMLAIKKATE